MQEPGEGVLVLVGRRLDRGGQRGVEAERVGCQPRLPGGLRCEPGVVVLAQDRLGGRGVFVSQRGVALGAGGLRGGDRELGCADVVHGVVARLMAGQREGLGLVRATLADPCLDGLCGERAGVLGEPQPLGLGRGVREPVRGLGAVAHAAGGEVSRTNGGLASAYGRVGPEGREHCAACAGMPGTTMHVYGWTGQQSSSGFCDLAPSILHYNWF